MFVGYEVSLLRTLSQCPGWIHPEEIPGESFACKTTSHWKKFEFPSLHSILNNLVQSSGTAE